MAQEDEQRQLHNGGEVAIKFGDVFEMSVHMAEQPISPRDAAAMESAENMAFGKTIKGGPASIMLDAAAKNLQFGLVDPHHHTASSLTQDGEFLVEGDPWEESQLSHDQLKTAISVEGMEDEGASGITIEEALEASARAIGDKPVDRADAAAIQAAEMIATGSNASLGSGLGAEAQAAATLNAQTIYDEDKTKLFDIIEGATNMLTDNKPVTEEDAERVKAAELQGDPKGVVSPDVLQHRAIKHSTTPGGVAEAVIAVARINKSDT
ncbi:late embryogenesis abundant protein 32-like [Silene latifolia]|uniref:late embryogenesis abundant protein 32-like n=1 Tax=Silene latifolia TaxID=37657 RepID=UPI003D77899C